MRGFVVNYIDEFYAMPVRLNGFRLGAVRSFDRRTRKCMMACLGWCICGTAKVIGATRHR